MAQLKCDVTDLVQISRNKNDTIEHDARGTSVDANWACTDLGARNGTAKDCGTGETGVDVNSVGRNGWAYVAFNKNKLERTIQVV